MSTPKLDVQPGWRGTDPDGGTWWRVGGRMAEVFQPWLSTGEDVTDDLIWRSQEEAEAAGLVDVVPQTHIDDLVKAHQEHITELRQQRDEAQRELSTALADLSGTRAAPAPLGVDELAQVVREVDGNHTLGAGALAEAIVEHLSIVAPAPLDPGNPEHLRQVADVLEAMPGETFQVAWESLNERIFRLEDAAAKKAREAEQDASDRKRAEEIATAAFGAKYVTEANIRILLQAVQAGRRAERQEAGQ